MYEANEHFQPFSVMESDDPQEKHERKKDSVHPLYFLVVLATICGLAYLGHYLHTYMPLPRSSVDAKWDEFSEERSWKHLVDLIGEGPRVAGSKPHFNSIPRMRNMLDDVARTAKHKVYVETDVGDGDFSRSMGYGFVNSYSRVTNLMALLEGESGLQNGVTNSSLLVNCHYDSVPTSPGASDNAIWCAVMIEVLAVMTQQERKPKHNVIFLFNGAEENMLQGAHSFLSHPWSLGAHAVVNLDSCGMGGRSVMFQASHSLAASVQSQLKRPHAQAIGEALFQSGTIPSDTDFRVFRDFARIPGVDMAFNSYGHVYHTKYDALYLMPAGVVQLAGDTLLDYVKILANTDSLNEKTEISRIVYWDYLGLFAFTYSYTMAQILDGLVVFIAMALSVLHLMKARFSKKKVYILLKCTAGHGISAICGISAALVAGLLSALLASPLRYYSQPLMLIPMYWLPFVITSCVVTHYYNKLVFGQSGLNRSSISDISSLSSILLWSVIMLVLPTAARYSVTIPLAILVAFFIVTDMARFKLAAPYKLAIKLVQAAPCLLWCFYLYETLTSMFVPILGRSGLGMARPDMIISIICGTLAFFSSMSLSGVQALFGGSGRWWFSLVCIGVVTCALAILWPINPYSGDIAAPMPQRHIIMHANRTFHNQNGTIRNSGSGYLLLNQDINSPKTFLNSVEGLTELLVGDMKKECEKEFFCGMPMYGARSIASMELGTWLEGDSTESLGEKSELRLIGKVCSEDRCHLHFNASGAPHLSFLLSPRLGIDLVSWSLISPAVPAYEYNGRLVYYIFHSTSTYSQDNSMELKITLEVPPTNSSETLLDIGFSSHQTHVRDLDLGTQLQKMLLLMPNWTQTTVFLSDYKGYMF